MGTADRPAVEPQTFSLTEAAAILGIGRSTAYRLARETGQLTDGLPVIWIGSMPKISRILLDRLLGASTPSAPRVAPAQAASRPARVKARQTFTYTKAEVARLLQCSPRTIERRVREGKIPTVDLGGRLPRFPKAAIDRLMAEGVGGLPPS